MQVCDLIVNTLIVTFHGLPRIAASGSLPLAKMKKTLIALIFAAVSAAASAQPYAYEPAVVRLTGTLLSAPGNSPNGKMITFPALQLASPILVEGPDDPTEKGVLLLHMVLNDKTKESFQTLKGKRATVTGTLFHSDNGNHQTNVLITPSVISPAR